MNNITIIDWFMSTNLHKSKLYNYQLSMIINSMNKDKNFTITVKMIKKTNQLNSRKNQHLNLKIKTLLKKTSNNNKNNP